MPAVKYYTVTQEREVKVSATSLLEAATIADRVFNDESYMSVGEAGTIIKPVHARDLVVREDF